MDYVDKGMDKLKDLKESLFPGGNKYVSNLSGASLQDLLRAATAKTLVEPDEMVNGQVVLVINEEANNSAAIKDITGLLRARCKQENPQKQYLAVKLIGKILRDCPAFATAARDDLLQEIAKIMYRPSSPTSPAGVKAKTAARELLRSFGRQGIEAAKSATHEVYGASGRIAARNFGEPAVMSGTLGGVPDSGTGVDATTMRQSIIDEIHRMVDQAKAQSELLSEMLLTNDGVQDDFNRDLITELTGEVKALRASFNSYLEQLSGMSENSEVELAMMQALEAVDILDNTLLLEKDVEQNKAMVMPAYNAPSPYAATTSAAPRSAPSPPPAQDKDLIALDDLADALTASAATGPSTSQPPPAYPPAGGYSQPPAGYGAPPPQQPVSAGYYQGGWGAAAPQPYYAPPAAAYAAPPAYPAATPSQPFAAAGPAPAPVFSSSNPFAGLAAAPIPAAAPPPPAMAVAPSPASPPGASAKVDAEWEMFFADRAQATGPATGKAPVQQDDSLI